MHINGENLDVNIYVELEPYLDMFPDYVVKEDKLQSRSPFREDRHPSFAVNLENGTWIDSGAVGEYQKGRFSVLLAYLREELVEDVDSYLIDVYSVAKRAVSTLKLDMKWMEDAPDVKVFTTSELHKYAFRHQYLGNRGITEEVQRLFRIGYDPDSKAVVIPHTDRKGNIVNLKFRSVLRKQFWYSNGQPIKNHLYGLYQCERVKAKEVYIVEAEIDCMRLWSEGKHAVALGTAHMSKRQKELLLNSHAETLIIATDNDRAGRECAKQLINEFGGMRNVYLLEFPEDVKDICDMNSEQINKSKKSCIINYIKY